MHPITAYLEDYEWDSDVLSDPLKSPIEIELRHFFTIWFCGTGLGAWHENSLNIWSVVIKVYEQVRSWCQCYRYAHKNNKSMRRYQGLGLDLSLQTELIGWPALWSLMTNVKFSVALIKCLYSLFPMGILNSQKEENYIWKVSLSWQRACLEKYSSSL